ncbi:hypothetical protein [Butyricicoccus sp. Marseille-Q5471]|uniref:hypothetical protein n=1 Tax=Butyricicoccus sp. Marseille-Q5471 TaxID=3039493 RepID=UPI0024BC6C5E|nr:hypothetical protein [Butyricicoccus sp. Marseille-Q5471]
MKEPEARLRNMKSKHLHQTKNSVHPVADGHTDEYGEAKANQRRAMRWYQRLLKMIRVDVR